MTRTDVTARVQIEHGPDDEALPLARCVCGATFPRWTLVLDMRRADPMPCCGRHLTWYQEIHVIEVSPEDAAAMIRHPQRDVGMPEEEDA